jgi:hypothetical protein
MEGGIRAIPAPVFGGSFDDACDVDDNLRGTSFSSDDAVAALFARLGLHALPAAAAAMGVENTHGTTSTNIVEPSKFDLVGAGNAVSSATATAAKFAGELLASRSDQHAAEVALEMVSVRAQARVSALEDALVRDHSFRPPVYQGGGGHILQHQTRCSYDKTHLNCTAITCF